MDDTRADARYYIMGRHNPDGMLLYSLPDPSDDDSWTIGQRFVEPPEGPVEIGIIEGYEQAQPLHWFDTPPVVSDALYDVLLKAGVANLEAIDAVLTSDDGRTRLTGYKAINVVGLVKAAGAGTRFDAANASRLIDASIDSLEIDPDRCGGARMFRLAEFSGAVVVDDQVKQAIEAAGLPWIVFHAPAEFIS